MKILEMKCPICKEITKLDSAMMNFGIKIYAHQQCSKCKKWFEIVSKNFKTKVRKNA